MSTEEKIPKEFQEYADNLILPENAELVWTRIWGWMINYNGCCFRLTDRSFGTVENKRYGDAWGVDDLNYWAGGSISNSIESVLRKKGHANILDIASGPLNKAAYNIAETYGDKVTVHAVDILGSKNHMKRENLRRIIDDARHLPYEDNSMDFVYSFQLVSHIPDADKKRCLSEALRVMSDKGEAVLDLLGSIGYDDRWLSEFTLNGSLPK